MKDVRSQEGTQFRHFSENGEEVLQIRSSKLFVDITKLFENYDGSAWTRKEEVGAGRAFCGKGRRLNFS